MAHAHEHAPCPHRVAERPQHPFSSLGPRVVVSASDDFLSKSMSEIDIEVRSVPEIREYERCRWAGCTQGDWSRNRTAVHVEVRALYREAGVNRGKRQFIN